MPPLGRVAPLHSVPSLRQSSSALMAPESRARKKPPPSAKHRVALPAGGDFAFCSAAAPVSAQVWLGSAPSTLQSATAQILLHHVRQTRLRVCQLLMRTCNDECSITRYHPKIAKNCNGGVGRSEEQ
jgi:hypothetical protein